MIAVQAPLLSLPTRGSAEISPCGRYRYSLTREFANGEGSILFIMLNPSVADAELDDPTLRRCIGFARRWDYRRLLVGNLFAFRSPVPRVLREVDDPVGPENDRVLRELAKEATCAVAAWGATSFARIRADDVTRLLQPVLQPVGLFCLGRTRHGFPRHPLYVPYDQPSERFP